MATPVYKTLSDIINRDDRYDVNKITFFTHTDDGTMIIPDTNLIDRYRRFLSPYVVQYTLNKKERSFYKYRPFQMAYDVYGTPDLGLLIMILNDRECPSKFTLKSTVKLIPPNQLETVYEAITIRTNNRLESNWAEQLSDWEKDRYITDDELTKMDDVRNVRR